MRRLQEWWSHPSLKRSEAVLLAVATFLVVGVDQVTKSLALAKLSEGPADIVGSLRLRLAFNDGAAFSIGRGVPPGVFAVGAVLLMIGLIKSGILRGRLACIAGGMIFGGATGNLVDRFARNHNGAVVDFIDLQWWPIFNVADAALSVGAMSLLVISLLPAKPVRSGTT